MAAAHRSLRPGVEAGIKQPHQSESDAAAKASREGRMTHEQDVFINCPFDRTYRPLMRALLFARVELPWRVVFLRRRVKRFYYCLLSEPSGSFGDGGAGFRFPR